MFAGRVQQADTPLRVLAAPATTYVADLLDAHDAVRRLMLLHAADAMQAPRDAGDTPALDASESLREALNALLNGAPAVAVTRKGAVVGTITFEDIRRAIAAAA